VPAVVGAEVDDVHVVYFCSDHCRHRFEAAEQAEVPV